jgi:hypothetical protein
VLAVTLPLALFLLIAVAAGPGQALTDIADGPSVLALSTIPSTYLTLYMQAARTCRPALECPGGHRHRREQQRPLPRPRRPLRRNKAGAEGPMQFLPATFRQYAVDADRSAPLTPTTRPT